MGTRVPAGTHRNFENLGTAGYRVPGKFEKLGTDGYRVPGKFSVMPTPDILITRSALRLLRSEWSKGNHTTEVVRNRKSGTRPTCGRMA